MSTSSRTATAVAAPALTADNKKLTPPLLSCLMELPTTQRIQTMTTAPPPPTERPKVLALQQEVLPLQITPMTRRLDKLELLKWVAAPSKLCKIWSPMLSLELRQRLLRRLF